MPQRLWPAPVDGVKYVMTSAVAGYAAYFYLSATRPDGSDAFTEADKAKLTITIHSSLLETPKEFPLDTFQVEGQKWVGELSGDTIRKEYSNWEGCAEGDWVEIKYRTDAGRTIVWTKRKEALAPTSATVDDDRPSEAPAVSG